MKLGTAAWLPEESGGSGAPERRALVAPLPSDPSRLVDLNRLERQRLAKLGEGRPEALAEALVPSCLGRLLEGGPRAIHRARQVLAYAEKWERRSGLPESLAPRREQVRLLACLPRPAGLRRWDGTALDPEAVQGPGASLSQWPAPTLALLGLAGGGPAGCCLAVEDARGVVLGAWLELDLDWSGDLELTVGGRYARLPLDTFCGLTLPALGAGEGLLAPQARLGPPMTAEGPRQVRVQSSFDRLDLHLDETLLHPTLQ